MSSCDYFIYGDGDGAIPGKHNSLISDRKKGKGERWTNMVFLRK